MACEAPADSAVMPPSGDSQAGRSRNSSLDACSLSSDSTSRRSSWSQPQASARNALRSLGACSTAPSKICRICAHRCGVTCASLHFAAQERASRAPVPLYSRRGYTHHPGRFFHRKSSEKTQFDELRLAGIQAGELVERRIEREHVDRTRLKDSHGVLYQYFVSRAAAPFRPMFACVIEEDAPHLCGGEREEVPAALHRLPLITQTQVGLVNQGRGLECMLTALAPKMSARQLPQFVVHHGRSWLIASLFPRPISPSSRVTSVASVI